MKCKLCPKQVEWADEADKETRDMICYRCWSKPFNVTSVCRADFQGVVPGEQIAKLEDANMEHLARKMADAYCHEGFWTDLEIIAENILEDL